MADGAFFQIPVSLRSLWNYTDRAPPTPIGFREEENERGRKGIVGRKKGERKKGREERGNGVGHFEHFDLLR